MSNVCQTLFKFYEKAVCFSVVNILSSSQQPSQQFFPLKPTNAMSLLVEVLI